MPKRCLFLCLTWLVLAMVPNARATSGVEANPGDPLTVELLTMGPGDHPFFKFGHNALRIRDEISGSDIVYNFGTFSFDSPTLIRDFFQGRLVYWLSKQSMALTLDHYHQENRTVMAQRLALSPEAKRRLRATLDENARPQNRAYKYDYFFDNCSTRLRDVLDRITGGRLHMATQTPARQTLRAHALRVTADDLLEYLVLALALGPAVDRSESRWAEAYLPAVLAEMVREVTIPWPARRWRPLVESEQRLLAAERVEPSSRRPAWRQRFLLCGIMTGLGVFVFAWLGERRRSALVMLGVMLVLGGLLVGLLGCALGALWLFTDHAATHDNQNLLLVSPLALVLPWVGIRLLKRGAVALRSLRVPAVLLAVSAILALLIKALPVPWQDNEQLIAYWLPTWLGLLGAGYLVPLGVGFRNLGLPRLSLDSSESRR
jgi:hypothetical protein